MYILYKVMASGEHLALCDRLLSLGIKAMLSTHSDPQASQHYNTWLKLLSGHTEKKYIYTFYIEHLKSHFDEFVHKDKQAAQSA